MRKPPFQLQKSGITLRYLLELLQILVAHNDC